MKPQPWPHGARLGERRLSDHDTLAALDRLRAIGGVACVVGRALRLIGPGSLLSRIDHDAAWEALGGHGQHSEAQLIDTEAESRRIGPDDVPRWSLGERGDARLWPETLKDQNDSERDWFHAVRQGVGEPIRRLATRAGRTSR